MPPWTQLSHRVIRAHAFPPPGEFTKSRLLDEQTPWGPCYFGAANRSSPPDSSQLERCILVFGVITTSCRMGTLVRSGEAYARVEYVGAARVSRRSILDIVDDELRLTKVCSCGV